MKNSIRNVSCFILVTALCLGLSLCAALIPREAIREHTEASAEYLCETSQYEWAMEGVYGSQVDHYADAIVLNISWHYDPEHLLSSVLKAEWYNDLHLDSPHRLLASLEGDLPANEQYLRYWHGSIALFRPLLAWLTLPQIYLLHAVLLGLLAAGLLVRLVLRRAYVPAVGMVVGLVGTGCWFVPMSLEYTYVFLVLFVQLHMVLMKSFPKDWGRRGTFFLVSGMITNYVDFLTCETLTLLVPLLLLLWTEREEKEKPSRKTLCRVALLWLVGYGGMYLAKWGISAVVLGENVMPYVTAHVAERLVGPVRTTDLLGEFIGALVRNVKMVFPLEYGAVGFVIWIALLVAAGYFGYVHHRKGMDRKQMLRYTVIALVPFARFLLLMNHSYRHYFFTYRAQLSTLLALVLILAESTGWGQGKHGKA